MPHLPGGAFGKLTDGDLVRYRCHTGHAFSPDSLLAEQSEAVEKALYSALRALEEKAAIAQRLTERFSERMPKLASNHQEQARELEDEVALLRQLLASGIA